MVAQAMPKADRERENGQFTQIPILVRLKARNLYLVQGLGHREIARQTGLTLQACQKLASREKWTALRRDQKLSLLAKQDASMSEKCSETLEAIASVSEQHAMRGLERVGEALESKGEFAARDFQSYTGGVKNLVSIMREIRAPQENTPSNAGLNVFVIRVSDEQVQQAPVATSSLA